MRKTVTCLSLIATSFALIASTAEAAKTSEEEGRKYSRKYVKQFSGRGGFPALGWKIGDCWRIGPDGAGNYRLFPGGVLCLYSSTKDTGRVPCWVLGIGVKDARRHIQASHVGSIQPWRGDSTYCDQQPGAPELPPHPSWGVTGNPLRPIAAGAASAGLTRSERAACQKRIDGVLRTIGARRNLSCRKATQITKRYILRKELPGEWYCSHLGASFGKCVDKEELYSEECVDRELRCVSSFNYAPGQRA
jgi:hypothetical protein